MTFKPWPSSNERWQWSVLCKLLSTIISTMGTRLTQHRWAAHSLKYVNWWSIRMLWVCKFFLKKSWRGVWVAKTSSWTIISSFNLNMKFVYTSSKNEGRATASSYTWLWVSYKLICKFRICLTYLQQPGNKMMPQCIDYITDHITYVSLSTGLPGSDCQWGSQWGTVLRYHSLRSAGCSKSGRQSKAVRNVSLRY